MFIPTTAISTQIATMTSTYPSSAMPMPRCYAKQQVIRLLSYNIQAGIPAENYRRYITGSWRHVLADASKHKNLAQIAKLLRDFDVVALQEVDAGSLRSGYVNQIEYLAKQGGFPHWYHQTNRNLGQLGQYSNGMLCRFNPNSVSKHKLPGVIPGRGAIMAEFGCIEEPLVVIVLHLALGKRARRRQLDYIAQLIANYKHVIIMGDMNCSANKLMSDTSLCKTDLTPVSCNLRTFPSWRPKRDLDHVFVSPSLTVECVEVIPHTYSDHLPLAIEISLPEPLAIAA